MCVKISTKAPSCADDARRGNSRACLRIPCVVLSDEAEFCLAAHVSIEYNHCLPCSLLLVMPILMSRSFFGASRERPKPGDSGLDPSRAQAAARVTAESCLALHKEALSRIMPVGLVYGNASPDDAETIWKKVMRCYHAENERLHPLVDAALSRYI